MKATDCLMALWRGDETEEAEAGMRFLIDGIRSMIALARGPG